ncbi:hypothetical protein C1N83_20695 [Priestia aryabhattai]|uniref:CDI toxin immunity protein n=1 Tax=Priestia TaxID=2800373 RepID=UPI00279F90D7|nr:hypothetical protein [Priestia megaterium]WDC90157.1 hypothetical protein PSR56_08995 [Priestia megaterium]
MKKQDRQKRLEFLLAKRKELEKRENKELLFSECVNALGKGVTIYSHEKSEERYCSFQKEVPFTFYGRIEWDKFNKYCAITYLEDVKSLINDDDLEIYWSTDNFPVLKTKLENVLSVYDDVIAVGSDTFLYVENKYVIEIYHDGEIRIGSLDNFR